MAQQVKIHLQCRRHRRCGLEPCEGKIPWRRKWQPTLVFLPSKSHGQRCLATSQSLINTELIQYVYGNLRASQVALVIKNSPANAGDTGSIPGSGRSPEGGHGNPLWYSCLENLMDRGAWSIRVIENRTGLKQHSMHIQWVYWDITKEVLCFNLLLCPVNLS